METLTWRQMALYGRAADRQRHRALEAMMAALLGAALSGGGRDGQP